jgi:hypothetical protein
MVLYIQQHKEYFNAKRHSTMPEQTSRRGARGKVAPIRSILPEIEAALNSGMFLKTIWNALRKEGRQMAIATGTSANSVEMGSLLDTAHSAGVTVTDLMWMSCSRSTQFRN